MSRAAAAQFWLDHLEHPTAQRVLAALDGELWLRVSEIKRESGVGGNAYPILSALCTAGLAAKRGGRVEQYRRIRSGQAAAGSAPSTEEGSIEPPPDDGEPGLDGPVAESRPGGWHQIVPDEEELTPDEHEARREYGLQRLDGILDSLSFEIGPPDLEAGRCGECGDEARRRWTLGRFQLCRACRTRRAGAAARLAADADGGPRREPPRSASAPPPLASVLVEQAASRRNGHHGDYDTDDLLPEVEW